MAELTIYDLDFFDVDAAKQIYSAIHDMIENGEDTKSFCGLEPDEIERIFVINRLPKEPLITDELAINKINKTHIGKNFTYIAEIHDPQKVAYFLFRAIQNISTSNPEIDPLFWKMAKHLAESRNVKISKYQIDSISAAGYNVAAVFAYALLVCDPAIGLTSKLTIGGSRIKVRIDIEYDAKSDYREFLNEPDPEWEHCEISTEICYYQEEEIYMMIEGRLIFLVTTEIPVILQAELPGNKISKIVESPYIVDATIEKYDGHQRCFIVGGDDRFIDQNLADIITERGLVQVSEQPLLLRRARKKSWKS